MRLKSPWIPRLADIAASPSERLIQALADDIADGLIGAEARLPAHRDLAYRLGIGLGTVTKAFAVLERRGLIRTIHGRGSFVAPSSRTNTPLIDLSVNTPPSMLSERQLSRTLMALAKRIDADLFSRYPNIGGHERHRQAMARWLSRIGMQTDPQHLLLCNGAQQALAVAFSALCPGQGMILTEAHTYPGALSLARHAGYRPIAIDMDEEGMIPDELDAALRIHTKTAGQLLIYVTPTMQNPTGATMRSRRRHAIVKLARQYDVPIVEDDVYALYADNRTPLALLAPERTFYVSSLSKTLSPGLRIGALIVPPAFMAQAEAALRASSLMVSALSCAIMEQWLIDGTAESILLSIRSEAYKRAELARSWLGNRLSPSLHDGFHVWLPMHRTDADHIEGAARAMNIALTPTELITVDPQSPESGIRLCLGGAALDDLALALQQIALLLSAHDGFAHRAHGTV